MARKAIMYCSQKDCEYRDGGVCGYTGDKDCTHILDIHKKPIFEGDLVKFSAEDDCYELAENSGEQTSQFTHSELMTLDCVLVTAIFGCDSRITELQQSDQRKPHNIEQLEMNQKFKAEYEALRKKVRKIAAEM